MNKERLCDRCSRRLVYRTKINLDPGARQLIGQIEHLKSELEVTKLKLSLAYREIVTMRSNATVRLFTKN